jgi:hypothetical protein
MASKRKPIAFSELDNLEPKGKGAILRTPEEIAAEEARFKAADQEELEVEELHIPEIQISRNPENKKSGNQENKKSKRAPSPSLPDAASLSPDERASYRKCTYRIRPESLDALEDIRQVLRRRYGTRINLEVIVEEAILLAYQDLEEKGDESFLANRISRNPEFK